jgi:hypothetical protein
MRLPMVSSRQAFCVRTWLLQFTAGCGPALIVARPHINEGEAARRSMVPFPPICSSSSRLEPMTHGKKLGIVLVPLAVAACALWFVSSPEHWMGRVDWPVVKIDDRLVRADVYIGNPTHWENEAIALVHVPGAGNYFLSFDGESYREASSQEFAHLPGGAWTIESMRKGHFSTALPFLNVNEFRVPSHGHTMTVQF